jgi:hypothetical protein
LKHQIIKLIIARLVAARCVCPAWAYGIKDTILFQRVKVPCVRESCPEALASRKLVCREAWSEGSETANPGSNEQELNKRLVKPDEVAHHTDVQRWETIERLGSRFSGYWGKPPWRGNMLLPGEVSGSVKIPEKSAEVIVADSNELLP